MKRFDWVTISYCLVGLIAICLLCRLWLPAGFLVAGHDSGLALDAKQFLNSRLLAWDDKIGFGQDNSMHFGSLVMHSLDYLFSVLAGTSYAGNWLNLFYWLGLMFVTSVWFAYQFKDRFGQYFVFLLPPFVVVNYYIIQSLFIIERAKYALLVASLILLIVVYRYLQAKLSLWWAVALTGLTFLFLNGGSWLGLPLYGSVLLIGICLWLYCLLVSVREHSWQLVVKLAKFSGLSLLLVVLLNSYALIPYLFKLTSQDISLVTDTSVIAANHSWLDYISRGSSFLNIIRLQGVPDWYNDGFSANLTHAYAFMILNNPILTMISFLVPFVVWSVLLIGKDRGQRYLIELAFLVYVVAMLLMAGSHPPLGWLYDLLYDHLPGFSIFRSPYYKFGSAFFISNAFLLAVVLSRWIELAMRSFKSKFRRQLVGGLLFGGVLIVWFGYHYLLFTPQIFSWQTGLSTRVELPGYVKDFISSYQPTGQAGLRTLLLPPLNDNWKADAYSWGYWSLSTLPSEISKIDNLANDNSLTSEELAWVNQIYQTVKDQDEEHFLSIAQKLNIGYLLVRRDVLSDGSWSAADSADLYLDKLKNFKTVSFKQAFGEWEVYQINDMFDTKIDVTNSVVTVPGKNSYLGRNYLQGPDYLLDSGQDLSALAGFITSRLRVVECQSCLLEARGRPHNLPTLTILPNSPLYFLKAEKDQKLLSRPTTDHEKIVSLVGVIFRRTAELKTMIDKSYDEKPMIETLKVINDYLGQIYELLRRDPNSMTDFAQSRFIMDNLRPVELTFLQFFDPANNAFVFAKRTTDFYDQMLTMMWNINRFRIYYQPLYSQASSWRKQKSYSVNFPQPGQYKLSVFTPTLPVGSNDKPILPTSVFLNKTEISAGLTEASDQQKWLTSKAIIEASPESKLVLNFSELPDKFQSLGTTTEYSIKSQIGCLKGQINNFRRSSNYVVSVAVDRKDQILKLYFVESQARFNKYQSFLHGEDEAEVSLNVSKPFEYVYVPSVVADQPIIYLCSNSPDLPIVKSLSVTELASPEVVLVKTNEMVRSPLPKISYKQVDPTRYVVEVSGASQPYILNFKESFSPFWKIRPADEDKPLGLMAQFASLWHGSDPRWLDEKSHLSLNGYTNGWVINQTASRRFIIEYPQQRYFWLGVVISASSLTALVLIMIYAKWWWRKNDSI